MAKGGSGKKDIKERKPKEKKSAKKRYELYEVSGGKAVAKNKHCPKCGRGTFMGKHKNRHVCGKCKYVEMTSVKKEE